MRRRLLLLAICSATIAAAVVAWSDVATRRAGSATPADQFPYDPDLDTAEASGDATRVAFGAQVAPVVARHCAACHSAERAEGGIVLALTEENTTSAEHSVWEKAAAAVRAGRMPPAPRPRLSEADSAVLTLWADQRAPRDVGRVALRRLNRAEYDNTIRDLVGVSIAPAADFPADDTADGFDTNADVLSISPLLTEKYLSAAESVVAAAASNPVVWFRLTHGPADDFIPFALRGTPPLRSDAVKNQRVEAPDPSGEAAEMERYFSALRAFADRAFRRPVSHAEMGRLMRFVATAVASGEGGEAGFKLALTAVLVSPHFLFRVELDPQGGPAPDRRLTDFETASRLSYFLWSSLPDDELSRLAAGGKLSDPRTLVAQVRRMLRDPKSRALAEHFAGQWLQTRVLTTAALDAELRHAMRTETELFFDHMVREDRSVLDLLTGEFTFVNARLARHYGLPGVEGAEFRRVSLAGTGRAGVLTHASVLTVTSGPTGTSPVKRGAWILENLLGAPPPPPPPGADALKDTGTGKPLTRRARFEEHRARAECASCHARMDPLGFGLENFDRVGAWRDRDGDAAVDASGVLPDGRRFRGPAELRAVLAAAPTDFTRCLTEKLMTYALGRSLRAADRSSANRIVQHAARNEYRFSSLIIALVRSDPFLMRRVAEGGRP
ncbi:DUF1592 domain-containing protein [Frigoriglobus tundricola]|uniref:Cytochrome c domain-containing protein n=1 Tax=Frigoriglobus tundricola TaxID=2774151 RepID=A0A6M5Z2K6_9BACT|nr:DUF1592 domain-containing protein [Frigoriglobus tundricola]QJW99422.1 hypothetical protein FTUN_7034 [Frigoriglobus tundricola]